MLKRSADLPTLASVLAREHETTERAINKLLTKDAAVHQWYRFVLSYPPHLVRHYLDRFCLGKSHVVLDPFSGTGTTLVECKKLGIQSLGIEANPMAHFASRMKTNWEPRGEGLLARAQQIAAKVRRILSSQGLDDYKLVANDRQIKRLTERQFWKTLTDDQQKIILTDSISPLPLHKALTLRDIIRRESGTHFEGHLLLALATAAVHKISNLHFGPEVGLGKIQKDASVVPAWLSEVHKITIDLDAVRKNRDTNSRVYKSDARSILQSLKSNSVDAVITSPPYPNEKDYTRTTRLESVLLGFMKNRADLRKFKQNLVRSNTRTVYKADDDDLWISSNKKIQDIAAQIENRRIVLGKTSGFEKMYARVTKLYFGGMARHLADLRRVLKPGARLAYVVGDQASYLQVMIRTGQLLGEIAVSLGYELVGIDLFRTRIATATREQLREEVVVLKWPGDKAAMNGVHHG